MPSPAHDKFRKSMNLDYEAWREGTPYDMEAFAEMTDAEKQAVIKETKAKGKGDLDWRDMEILAHDNSNDSFDRLRDELVGGSADTRAKALRQLYAMKRMNRAVYDLKLSQILDDVTSDDGVTSSLLRVDEYCGEHTRMALLRGVRDRPDVALHFAANLMDQAGLSNDMAAFDPKFRPTLLKLLPDEKPEVRAAALKQVFEWLKVDPKEIK